MTDRLIHYTIMVPITSSFLFYFVRLPAASHEIGFARCQLSPRPSTSTNDQALAIEWKHAELPPFNKQSYLVTELPPSLELFITREVVNRRIRLFTISMCCWIIPINYLCCKLIGRVCNHTRQSVPLSNLSINIGNSLLNVNRHNNNNTE